MDIKKTISGLNAREIFSPQRSNLLMKLKIIAGILLIAALSNIAPLKMIGGLAYPLVAYIVLYYYHYFPEDGHRAGLLMRLWIAAIILNFILVYGKEGVESGVLECTVTQINMIFIPAVVLALIYHIGKLADKGFFQIPKKWGGKDIMRSFGVIAGGGVVVFFTYFFTHYTYGGLGGFIFVWIMSACYEASVGGKTKWNAGRALFQVIALYLMFLNIWGDALMAVPATVIGMLYIPLIYILREKEKRKVMS